MPSSCVNVIIPDIHVIRYLRSINHGPKTLALAPGLRLRNQLSRPQHRLAHQPTFIFNETSSFPLKFCARECTGHTGPSL